MEKKDKKILIISSGVFLIVLVFILFLTMQSRDNMISNAGRYKGTDIKLGDATHVDNCDYEEWSCDDSMGYTAVSGECRKLTETNIPQATCESTSGLLWKNGTCYSMSDVSSTAKIWTCRTCKDGYEVNNGVCTVNTNQGCCYKIGTTWYFEENDENCSDLGATIGNKDKLSCLAQNSDGEPEVSISINNTSYTVKVDGTITLDYSVTPSGTAITWQTSDTHIATVSNGVVTGTGVGTATITATAGGKTATTTVNVTSDDPNELYKLEVSPLTLNVEKGKGGQITATMTSPDNDCVGNGTCEIQSYSSSDTNIARVSANGYVIGVSVGNATITVTARIGAYTRTATVNVVVKENTSDNKNCNVSVETNSNSTSIQSDNIENSYYTVQVTVSGDGCYGQTLSYSATNSLKLSKTSDTIGAYSENVNSATFWFAVYPKEACDVSTATATLTNGNSDFATVNVILYDWVKYEGCYTDIGDAPTSSGEADNRELNVYYTRYGQCPNSTSSGFLEMWRRDGCDITPTPTPTKYCCRLENSDGNQYNSNQTSCTGNWKVYTGTCRETPACYLRNSDNTYVTGSFKDRDGYTPVDSSKCSSTPVTPVTEEKACYVKYGNGTNNQYCYNTASNCAGYTKVNRSEAMCNETPACYLNKNDGKYYTGSFSNQSNYSYYGTTCPKEACYIKPDGTYEWTDSPVYGSSLVSAVNSEADCKPAVVTPPPSMVTQYACYVNSTTNDYKWATASPGTGYVVDNSINNATSCRAPQSPGCYINLSTGSYTWGLYDNVVGYNHVSSITTQSKCVDPSPACYVDSVGNYVWGRYENDSNYTVISSITTQSACKRVISNVPKTDLDVSTVIYIAIVVLSVFGVGFVYYANSKKKLYK